MSTYCNPVFRQVGLIGILKFKRLFVTFFIKSRLHNHLDSPNGSIILTVSISHFPYKYSLPKNEPKKYRLFTKRA